MDSDIKRKCLRENYFFAVVAVPCATIINGIMTGKKTKSHATPELPREHSFWMINAQKAIKSILATEFWDLAIVARNPRTAITK